MNWDERIEKAQKLVDIFVKADAHAFMLVIGGLILKLKGHDDPGLILAGLAIFKGNR
jgi:hypothetical protein